MISAACHQGMLVRHESKDTTTRSKPSNEKKDRYPGKQKVQ